MTLASFFSLATSVATSGTLMPALRFGGSLTDENKVIVCAPCDNDKGYLTLKDWLRKLRRENDPREPTVKAFRAARKAAVVER